MSSLPSRSDRKAVVAVAQPAGVALALAPAVVATKRGRKSDAVQQESVAVLPGSDAARRDVGGVLQDVVTRVDRVEEEVGVVPNPSGDRRRQWRIIRCLEDKSTKERGKNAR
mmetsp:Transcript_28072/g.45175  ORF Transcript_28072/g.45175 Transcript_28072/m.45175 type:complete len:112 (-) Transcript_28072:1451-1786(-)